MELNDLLFGVLTKTLNKSEEEISALLYTKAEDSDELILKDDALELVLDADVSRVDKIKKSVKPDPEALKSQYSRGLKEAMENYEKELRETYSSASDAQGLDLVKAIINSETKNKSKLTDDDVKKHPLYLDLEKNRVTKEKYDSLESEFNDYKSNQARNARLSDIKKDVMTIFDTLNAVQSDNPTVARNRINDFLSKFEQANLDYEIQEDGNHVITKDGSRLEDDHGNPLKFKEFVVQNAQLYYDFAKSDAKGNAGNSGGDNGGGSHIDVPKTKEEYLKYMATESDPAKRVAMNQAWEAQNP